MSIEVIFSVASFNIIQCISEDPSRKQTPYLHYVVRSWEEATEPMEHWTSCKKLSGLGVFYLQMLPTHPE